MKNIKTKNKNAITLIALVITIIIMLLLAAVAIQLTLGENGLIAKAAQAKTQQAKAELYDTAKLEYLNLKTKALELRLSKPQAESVLSETNFLNKYNVVGDNITNKKSEIIDTKENLIKFLKNNEQSSSNSEQLILELNVIASGVLEFYCNDSNTLIEIEYHDNSKETITDLGYHPCTTKNYAPGKYTLKLKALNNNHLNGLILLSSLDMTLDIHDWGRHPNKQTRLALSNINNIVSPEPDYLTVEYYKGKFNSIPSDLFSQKKNNEIMSSFSHCNNITSIPEDLFKNCVNSKTFENTFSYCNNIKSIPENIFKYNINVESFSRTFQGFTGSTIPENIFKYNIKAKNFDETFAYSKISSIPENLFTHNPNINSLKLTFQNCTQLTHIPQTIINKALSTIEHRGMFRYCPSASNYNSIPAELKQL